MKSQKKEGISFFSCISYNREKRKKEKREKG